MRTKIPWDLAVAGFIKPQDGNGSTLETGAIDMHTYAAILCVLQLGVLNDSGTITGISVQESATTMDGDFGAMSPQKRMSSKTGTDDNSTDQLVVYREDMSEGKRYLRLVFTCSAHSEMVAAAIIGILPPPGEREGARVGYVPQRLR